MREWKAWHQNPRVKDSRYDSNYIVSPETHVDIIGFKPELALFSKRVGPHMNFLTLTHKNLP